jgi:hypothetical protein
MKRAGISLFVVVQVALVALVALSTTQSALAQEGSSLSAPVPIIESPAALLEKANAAVDASNFDGASALFVRIVDSAPNSAEALVARRSLKMLYTGPAMAAATSAPAPAAATRVPLEPIPVPVAATPVPLEPIPVPASTPPPKFSPGGDQLVYRLEPYSLRTKERLNISTWEKIDFGVTAFVYGASVGLSLSLALQPKDLGGYIAPIVIGASIYTLGSLVYLNTADPDRGDLPLVLAISSYVPTTAVLAATAIFEDPDGKAVSAAAGIAGLLAVPAAAIAAQQLSLDPGDTQLVRDAGFWGMAAGLGTMMAFGGSTYIVQPSGYVRHDGPTTRALATGGLIGLYTGLGLGLLGAHYSDVSLERVRVTTWGGYGGTVLGLLVGLAADDDGPGMYRGALFGGLGGLVIAFAAASGLDLIPSDATLVAEGDSQETSWTSGRAQAQNEWATNLAPLFISDARGQPCLGYGLTVVLP